MLTQLRLKNWRSIKEATIDFTPITVLIGANSSGKTNIVEAFSFTRRALLQMAWRATAYEVLQRRIATLDAINPVELEFRYVSRALEHPANYRLRIDASVETPYVDEEYWHDLGTQHHVYMQGKNGQGWYPAQGGFSLEAPGLVFSSAALVSRRILADPKTGAHELFDLLTRRTQRLAENFMPELSLSADDVGDTLLLEPNAHNMIRVLEFMERTYPDTAKKLYDDLKWMLPHVKEAGVRAEDTKTRMIVRETEQAWEAPTISAGTARLTAMLAAHYALEMQDAEQPGLVVIEEPDTALNPGLLRKFVEQIRNYVEGEYPRQFIFTTHNPSFLNYFQPEEVRVVERDEQGFTTVKLIPDHIREIWLDEYTLGEVWMTRSLGGLPE